MSRHVFWHFSPAKNLNWGVFQTKILVELETLQKTAYCFVWRALILPSVPFQAKMWWIFFLMMTLAKWICKIFSLHLQLIVSKNQRLPNKFFHQDRSHNNIIYRFHSLPTLANTVNQSFSKWIFSCFKHHTASDKSNSQIIFLN